ncbi:MAG TPA: alpha/beta hydrolase-fold protein [Blastocatellia bacterium]
MIKRYSGALFKLTVPALLSLLFVSAAPALRVKPPEKAATPVLAAQAAPAAGPLRFHVALSSGVSSQPLSGRLIVFMSDAKQQREMLDAGFIPGSVWVAAMEVEAIRPGETIYFDPDVKAYPAPFSKAKAGSYQFMALLDTDHSYAYSNQMDGNSYYGPVTRVAPVDPSNTAPIELTIGNRHAAQTLPDNPSIKLVEFQSPMLSRFWGRPIYIQAGVVLPPSYNTSPDRRYPTAYLIHGFGGDHTGAWRQGPSLINQMTAGRIPEFVYVFLNGHLPTGHHEFADSVNNGPWGAALTEEFIPYLEKEYRLVAHPYARFLTGHSSGGWSTLWLQVTYPDFFGGTWSTSPDPVDLRSFTGIDASPGSTDNAYINKDGSAKNLVRMDGKDVATTEQFARQEDVLGEYGGQFASFEWVWSPKGPGGRPMKMFNRETGQLNQDVLQAWTKYDIRRILDEHWSVLGPKLKGKINLVCGTADTFHLNEPLAILCDFFKQKGSDAVCEMVPGRTHMDLYRPYDTYPDGLQVRIFNQMQAKFENAGGAGAKKAAHASK